MKFSGHPGNDSNNQPKEEAGEPLEIEIDAEVAAMIEVHRIPGETSCQVLKRLLEV